MTMKIGACLQALLAGRKLLLILDRSSTTVVLVFSVLLVFVQCFTLKSACALLGK